MATLTIRNLPDDVYARLRIRAAENQRSMEAEARELVTKALPAPQRSPQEAVRRLQQMVDRLPKKGRDNFTVEKFLAERRKIWGEE